LALNIGELFAIITADNSELKKALNESSSAFKEAGSKITDIGKSLTTSVTLPIAGAGFAAIKMASDVSESTNKVNVAFKKNAKSVQDWSKTTLKTYGIAKGTALDMAALYGDMGTAMGQTTDEAEKMSTSLVGLAGDLASFKNIGIEQAQDALKGIFTGEGEALKSLGIIMQDSTLEAFALSEGLGKTYSKMTQSEKVALRYKYVMENAKNAQGDFARTQDGAANQMRIFQESVKETSAEFGEILLPYFTEAVTEVNKLVDGFKNLDDATKKTVLSGLGIAAILGPIVVIAGTVVNSIGAIAAGFAGLSASAAPIAAVVVPVLAVIAAIAALVAGMVYLYNTNEKARNMMNAAWEEISLLVDNSIKQIVQIIQTGMEVGQQVITEVLAIVKEVWDKWGADILQATADAFTKLAEWIMIIFNDLILPFVQGAIDMFSEIWSGGLKNVVEQLMIFAAKATEALLMFYNGFIAPIVDFLLTILVPIFQVSFAAVGDALTTFLNMASGVITGVLEIFNGLIDFIVGVFTGNWSKAWEGVKTIFKGVFDSLYAIAKVPLNWIIGGINRMISGLNSIQIPDWVPGLGGKGLNIGQIPMLKNGGIVDKPTLAMIGEGVENEVVLPLSKLKSLLGNNMGKRGIIQFNITGNTIANDYSVDRIMNQAVKRLRYEGVY
jgi:phage-related protein